MTATDQSAADPACIDEPTLWAVHVTGPDDLLPCASRRLAARNATWFNLGNIRNLQSLDAEHAPLTYATPVPWTGTAEGHAEALARENQADVRWSDPAADVLDARPNTLTGEWQYGIRDPEDGTTMAHDEATARRRAAPGNRNGWQLVRRHVGAWQEVPTP